ncbi:MAG TPA: TonB-dependent receptor [Woeseiaceae bacterium]|nr:TonB-dependent receptor [Woeseiaceae bacterium]
MHALVLCAASALIPAQSAASDPDTGLSEITVSASRIANTRPAGSFAALATALRFDPQTELQSRGLPEGQADVTVRGGLFENTGFNIGAVTIMDPQTGHYAGELPIDPALLSRPHTLTGTANALRGFNSTIGTIAYSVPAVPGAGDVTFGAGGDALRFASLRAAVVGAAGDDRLAARLSIAASSGDGSLPGGDHDFGRYNLQLQRAGATSQSDLIAAYQDKFYGWPGAYTGFAALPETDRTKTTLLFANHRRALTHGWLEIGAYHRRLINDYDFDRHTQESGGPGAFDHETRVDAVGVQGLYRHGRIDWRYGGQLTGDELVRSTDLTNGTFERRRYLKIGVLPSIDLFEDGGRSVSLRAGVTWDASNRDSNTLSPLAGATFRWTSGGSERYVDLEYAATSQVPGYTALKSGPSGLFGGNPALDREQARQLALTAGLDDSRWSGKLTLFYREDDELVDWTYDRDAPFTRAANPLDADVVGLEALFSRRWQRLQVASGYTFIDKDADFGAADVDASFYALNYARHRATLAVTWRLSDRLEWRMDSEYRVQRDNPLRTSSANAVLVSASLAWEPPDGTGLGLALTADNLTDSDYQYFPGTPAVGRQLSLSARYAW